MLQGTKCTATRTVNVENHPPVAADDSFAYPNNKTITIPVSKLLSNDSDPEGTSISFVSVGKASNNATLVSGFNQLLLIVKRGYTGNVTFTYVIKDANGLQSTGEVTVNVNNARLF